MASAKSKLFFIVIASMVISIFTYNYFLKSVTENNNINNFKDSLNSTNQLNDSIYPKTRGNINVTAKKANITSNNTSKDVSNDTVIITMDRKPNNSTKVENSVIHGENINIGSGTQQISKQ